LGILAKLFDSGKVSGMRSFTLQQVRGKASAVLDACDRKGRVRITRSDRESYIIERLEHSTKKRRTTLKKSVARARNEFKSGKLRPAAPLEIMRKIFG
jgi:hypothetical protein